MPVPENDKKRGSVLLLVLLLFCAGMSEASAQTVKLPITIDYSLLQTLIVRSAYTEADQSATLLNKGNGCVYLILSKPSVSEANGLIRFETQVSVHAGTPLGDKCLIPVSWQGYLVLYQRPVIDGKTWKLSFATTSSALLNTNRRPAKIAGVVWDIIKSKVFSYLESISIDLAPPVNDLKTFLLPLFPQSVQQQTQTMLRTLRTGETRITPKAVIVELLADVQEANKTVEARQAEVLSGKELDDMVGIWEQWDALLSYMISIMSRNVLTEEERQTLMDVLLETRYAFVEGLSSQNLHHDFVREQFVRAWRRLSPIFRNHAGKNSEEQTLGYLSFFTAADALSVLDGLGPTFGIEMSRDGLIRMARMLTSDPSILNYSSGVNPDLRKLFQLMPALQVEKKETPDDMGARSAIPEERKIEEHPIDVEGKSDQGRMIDQSKKEAPADEGKNDTQVVPSDTSMKSSPSGKESQVVPEKPVERDLTTGELTKPSREAKPTGQADEKSPEIRSSGSEIKGELGRLINRIKKEAPADEGKNSTQVVPSDPKTKSFPSEKVPHVVPEKPVEKDLETGDLNKQSSEIKPSYQPAEKKTEDLPNGPEVKGELNRLIDQIKQEAPVDKGANGTQPVPPDTTMKNTLPAPNNKAVPEKPVEQDIDIDKAFKTKDVEKPPARGDGKKESQTSPDGKSGQDKAVGQEGQAPEHDQTMKSSLPDQKIKAAPDKSTEQDIDADDPFNLPDKQKPFEKDGVQPPVDPKDKQTKAFQVPLGAMIWDFLFPPAFAGDLAKYDVLKWKVPESGVDEYIKRVEDVLKKTSQVVVSRKEFPASLQGMYHSMIIAMAWQESCFRQFIEKNHQLTYLLSYNNTSVGLMQVNERIWRGLYDQEKLRWDIEYNAAAGNEIAYLYLQKYALRDKNKAKKLDPATLARLVYAMYNGGPGQYHDFLERFRKGKMLSSDDLFWEKYSLVAAGKGDKLSQCLTGN